MKSLANYSAMALLALTLTYSAVGQTSQGGGGGSSSGSSPSSLTTFFNKFMGLAPDDCGNATCTTPVSPAIRYVHFCYDGAIAGQPTTTFTSAACAGFVAADVGSVIEIKNGLAGPALFTGTISAVNSATSITVSGNLTLNGTSLKFWYGSDATTALQNWATAINNGVPTATGLQSHQGYLPGFYGTTKPVRLINPLGVRGGLNSNATGFGTPEPFSANQADESLAIWGAGAYRSGIVALSTFNWGIPNTTVSNGVLYTLAWNGDLLQSFSVLSPDSSIAYNTTANTQAGGCLGGLVGDFDVHSQRIGMQVLNFHNTTNNLGGHVICSAFESSYYNNQFYANDDNALYFGALQRPHFYNDIWEGAIGNANFELGAQAAATTITGLKIFGGAISGQTGFDAIGQELDINNVTQPVAGDANDQIVFSGTQINSPSSGVVDIRVLSSSTINLLLDGVTLSNSSASTAPTLFNNLSTTSTVYFTGGRLFCAAGTCTQGVANTSGSTIYNSLGQWNTTVTGTGSGSVFQISPVATGFSGLGVLQNTLVLSNQGTACTNGELALSAGWQSTGSATVTAAAGTGQTCSWTITTGTTTAANPTVTDTLTNVLPTATTVCWMTVNGGTHTPVVGAGTSDAFRQTTLSATAPIFTYQETPTAGGTTYFVTRSCGP